VQKSLASGCKNKNYPAGLRSRDPKCRWSVSPVPIELLGTCGNAAAYFRLVNGCCHLGRSISSLATKPLVMVDVIYVLDYVTKSQQIHF